MRETWPVANGANANVSAVMMDDEHSGDLIDTSSRIHDSDPDGDTLR